MRTRPFPLIFTVALACLLALPVLPIIYQAFLTGPIYDHSATLTLGNFSRLFSQSDFLDAALNTFYFGVLSTIIALVIGLFASLALERLDFPFRKTIRLLFLAPIFISTLLVSFAWSMLYGPGGYLAVFMKANFGFGLPNLFSIGGMSVIAGISQAPVSYLFFASAAANIPDVFERSARCSGASPLMAIWTIVLPLLRPAILYFSLLNFMFVVDLLALPLIIGEPARIEVLSSFLYTKGLVSANVDYGIIAAAAVCMVILVQGFVLLQTRWVGDSRRYVTVGARSSKSLRVRMGGIGWVLFAVFSLYILATSMIPVAFLVLRSFTSVLTPFLPISDSLTLANFQAVYQFPQYVRSVVNTLVIGVVGGVIAVILTFVTGVVAYRLSPELRRTIEQIAVFPRAVPGLVVGLGFFYAMVSIPGGEYLRNTILILIIAYTVRYFPSGFGAMSPGFMQISAEMERAVYASGGSRLRAILDVTLPLMKGAIGSTFILYLVSFFKEYSAAAFLYGPGTEVIGTTMLQLGMIGSLGNLAALGVVQLIITVPFAVYVYARGQKA